MKINSIELEKDVNIYQMQIPGFTIKYTLEIRDNVCDCCLELALALMDKYYKKGWCCKFKYSYFRMEANREFGKNTTIDSVDDAKEYMNKIMNFIYDELNDSIRIDFY